MRRLHFNGLHYRIRRCMSSDWSCRWRRAIHDEAHAPKSLSSHIGARCCQCPALSRCPGESEDLIKDDCTVGSRGGLSLRVSKPLQSVTSEPDVSLLLPLLLLLLLGCGCRRLCASRSDTLYLKKRQQELSSSKIAALCLRFATYRSNFSIRSTWVKIIRRQQYRVNPNRSIAALLSVSIGVPSFVRFESTLTLLRSCCLRCPRFQ